MRKLPGFLPSVTGIGLLIAGRVAASPPAPPPAESARAAVQAAYDQINAAFLGRDLDRVMSYFTPDYLAVDGRGAKTDREQTRRKYQDQLRQIKTMRDRYAVGTVTPTPDGVLVAMTMHTDGTGEKRILFAKFHGTFTNDLSVRDLWVQTPQGWRLKHRQTLRDETHTHPG